MAKYTRLDSRLIDSSLDTRYTIAERKSPTNWINWKKTEPWLSKEQETAENVILWLKPKELKELTLKKVINLLWDTKWVISSPTILLNLAKSNQHLLDCLGYQPTKKWWKVIWVSRIL